MNHDLAIAAAEYFAARSPAEWWLHFQPGVEGVSCPEEWKRREVVALRLNAEKVHIRDTELQTSVLVGGMWTPIVLPWVAIGAIANARGAGVRQARLSDGAQVWIPFLAETQGPALPHEGEGLSAEERFLWAVSTPVERRRQFIRLLLGGAVTPSPVTPAPTTESPQCA